MKLLRRPITASERIPDRFCVISMEFLSLSRRRSSLRNVPRRRWARRNVCRSQAKPFTPCAMKTIIFQRENLNYLIVCFTRYPVFPKSLFSIADLFAVRYLWVVCKEDKCCVVTQRAADIRVAWLVTFARIACLLQLWIKTSKLDYSIWATPKWKFCIE